MGHFLVQTAQITQWKVLERKWTTGSFIKLNKGMVLRAPLVEQKEYKWSQIKVGNSLPPTYYSSFYHLHINFGMKNNRDYTRSGFSFHYELISLSTYEIICA